MAHVILGTQPSFWANRFVAPQQPATPTTPLPSLPWSQWHRRIDPFEPSDSPEAQELEGLSAEDPQPGTKSGITPSGGEDGSIHLEVQAESAAPEEDISNVALEQVLQQQFRQLSPDGYLLSHEVPGILSSIGLTLTDGAIQTALALAEIPLDAKAVTFDQLLTVLNVVTKQQATTTEGNPEVAESAGSVEALERGSASDRSSLTLLITTVSVIMLLTASLVVGLSIMWLLFNGISQAEQALQSDVQWVGDLMNYMITTDYVAKKQAMNLNFALIIAALTEVMGYAFATALNQDDLTFADGFLTQVVGQWWNVEAMDGMAEAAQQQAFWLADLMQTLGAQATYSMASQMAQDLPQGYELLVGHWADASNTTVTLLFPPRYAADCAAASCDSTFASGMPFAAALAGASGSVRTTDYRSKPTIAGYAPLAAGSRFAVVLKVDLSVVHAAFVSDVGVIVDNFNSDSRFTTEIVGAQKFPNGTLQYITTLPNCTGACQTAANESLYSGGLAQALLANASGIDNETDYTGQPVIGAYQPLPEVGLAFYVKDYTSTLKNAILTQLGLVTDQVNAQLPGTEEIEESQVIPTPGGGYTLRSLTHYRFADECANHTCTFSGYITTPAANCSSGTMTSLDYRRTVPVSAGYTCMPALSCVEAYSVDYGQLLTEGTALGVAAIDSLNAAEMTTVKIEIAVPQTNLTAAQVTSGADVSYMTTLGKANECPNGVCPGPSTAMQLALQGANDVLSHGSDYLGTSVYGASLWLPSLNIGITAEQDTVEIMAPILQIMWQLIATSFGLVVACTLLLLWYTISVVLSMAQAEKEGQEAIRAERGRFGALVAAMYPSYVVDRVLAGDRQIVQLIPQAAVFFSDIYNFTMASNRLSSEQLLELLAYTYGVMDIIAEYYHVLKVKTIGDAYLAITGLPGMGNVHCCLDMMHFAAAVARVFSRRFDHPKKGVILTLLHDQPKRRAARVNGSKGGTDPTPSKSQPTAYSGSTPTLPSDAQSTVTSSTTAAHTVDALSRQAHCAMSYGIVVGPVTAGVLQGKSPMFDIWGKTVNLASRMQSTSVPGRIQVSEAFCRAVMATPEQPFTFDVAHDSYCKGFGMAKSFFVRGTTEPLPKDLQGLLGLELNHGTFFFDAVPMPSTRMPANMTSKQALAGVPSFAPYEKTNTRSDPVVVSTANPIPLFDMDVDEL